MGRLIFPAKQKIIGNVNKAEAHQVSKFNFVYNSLFRNPEEKNGNLEKIVFSRKKLFKMMDDYSQEVKCTVQKSDKSMKIF